MIFIRDIQYFLHLKTFKIKVVIIAQESSVQDNFLKKKNPVFEASPAAVLGVGSVLLPVSSLSLHFGLSIFEISLSFSVTIFSN